MVYYMRFRDMDGSWSEWREISLLRYKQLQGDDDVETKWEN